MSSPDATPPDTRSPRQRLAAVLVADIAEFSRLTAEDEAETLAALRELRAEADRIVAAQGGRLVKATGDGILVEFGSIASAVAGALALQEAGAAFNAGRPANRLLLWRIGLHLGDVMPEGDDILGDTVNVAARLQNYAAPGGICISRAVRDQIRDRLSVDLADLGELVLKNLPRPVRAFELKSANAPSVDNASGEAAGPSAGSVILAALAGAAAGAAAMGALDQGLRKDDTAEED